MKDLATTILSNCSQAYFDKISLMSGDEILQYNKTVMGLTTKSVGIGMSGAIEWNAQVKKGGLQFRIEPRKGYKLLTYYIN